jgi:hypothetical protein
LPLLLALATRNSSPFRIPLADDAHLFLQVAPC